MMDDGDGDVQYGFVSLLSAIYFFFRLHYIFNPISFCLVLRFCKKRESFVRHGISAWRVARAGCKRERSSMYVCMFTRKRKSEGGENQWEKMCGKKGITDVCMYIYIYCFIYHHKIDASL